MAVTFLEPGGDADFGVGLWPTKQGSPAAVSDFVHGGHRRSIGFPVNTQCLLVTPVGVVADAGGRFSAFFYLNALPAAAAKTIAGIGTSAGSRIAVLALTTGGVLTLTDASNVQIGTNGKTLSTGRWYRISMAWTITSTTVNRFEIFVDGASSISVTNGTLTRTASSVVIFGSVADTAQDLRVSDIYIDNSNALTDPGNIWVTAKRPFANGTTNGFTTQIGAGGGSGYGTGHAPQVNERPSNTANGWSVVGAGSAVTEEYTIEGKNVGDIDISSSTIVDYMGWVIASSVTAETASIIVGGVSSNISLSNANLPFSKMAGSSIYPAGGTDIGIVTSTTLTTVGLYEAGIIVAYIPRGPLLNSGLDGLSSGGALNRQPLA